MKTYNKLGIVYRILCDIPAMHVVYVGKTTQTLSSRFSHHCAVQRRPTKINKYIREVGREHFTIEAIEQSYDQAYIAEREVFWTKLFGCTLYGCNERLGSAETTSEREKRSMTSYRNREVVCDNDNRVYRSCSEAAKAYSVSRADVSECCARRLKQSKGYRFRYTDTDKDAYTRYWAAGITRNRPVRCIETAEKWSSASEASAALGIPKKHINRLCQSHARSRVTNTHFEYVQQ